MRRTLSEMQEICQQFEQSGLSRRVFCKQHNIAHQTFHYWYKRIASKESSGFTEIALPSSRKTFIDVVFPSGARITFQTEPSASWLRELVS